MANTDTLTHRPPSEDPFDLDRFVMAQEAHYGRVLSEIKNGKKRTHWMWYIFPQIVGLSYSPISRLYAIKSLAEAKAYLHHPILGARLLECADAVATVQEVSASDIFGEPDDAKLRSCATLFASVPDAPPIFLHILARYFHGEPDGETLDILKCHGEPL